MRRWLRHFEVNGTVWRDPRRRNLHGDAAIRDPHLTRAVLTLAETETVAFLRDHVDLLVALSFDYPESDHRYVSAATVYHMLRFHQYTRKKIERLYAESSLSAQRAFAVLFNEIPLRCIVSVDETHTGGSDMYQRYGRSLRNVACILRDRDTRPIPRTSTMMAVTLTHGVLWSQTVIVGSAQTADDWRLFLQCLHVQRNTYILAYRGRCSRTRALSSMTTQASMTSGATSICRQMASTACGYLLTRRNCSPLRASSRT